MVFISNQPACVDGHQLYIMRFAVCSTDSIMFLHHMTATLQLQIDLFAPQDAK